MAFENLPTTVMPETSHISEIGYDPIARVMLVRYRRGGAGIYHGPTSEEFQAAITDSHPGSYIHRYIKNKYGYEPI